MSVEVNRGHGASETQAAVEMSEKGFTAAAKDYEPGHTEPHRHEYDICLHILEGEFRLGLPEEDVVHSYGPGDRLFVPAGTLHFEDHGELRMVVGRRQPLDEQLEANTAKSD
ncbi:MAG TPA: cupin domain-containing protein [Sphingomicrobium sp.]|nr:cupin domain-containing protein [Sphingomicrobium sp.]